MAVSSHFLSGVWHSKLSLGTPSPPEPQHPTLTLWPRWEHVSHFSGGQRYSATISVVNSALPSEYPLLHFLWGSNVSTCPDLWGSFWVCRNFSSFTAPSPGHKTHPEVLCLLKKKKKTKLYLLPYLILRRLVCLLLSWMFSASILKAFCRSCSYVDEFLMYLWGGKWSHLILPPSWKFSLCLCW